ncbi:MAG: RIP metalloprotease RseP [Candidatus Paceibacterota bacterium]|jgi:regulator of sigma E protease
MNILIFLVILLVLVISHEFGHFFVAKKSGIRVDEFSFGFPPKLFGKKIGETTYNFNALPFGGYVKIFGENPDEDSINGPDSKRSFVNKPRYIQAGVLLAGVLMNFLVAWLLFSVGFISGLPTSVGSVPKGAIVNNQALTITSVLPDSPAEVGGIKTGDKILSLETSTDSTKLLSSNFSASTVQSFIKAHSGEEVTISLIRKGEQVEVMVVPEESNKSNSVMIGISMDIIGTLKLPIHRAVWEGLKLSADVFVATVVGFYNLIHDALLGQADMNTLTGPVGIVGVVGDAAEFGFIYLLSFTALISINLAVINLLPFPALDGGRLLFVLIEKIKGSRIKPQIANVVNMIGFGLLMVLMVVITYHDIVKLL